MTKVEEKLPHRQHSALMKFINSFGYASRGIWWGASERNMRVHILATVVVVAAGVWFQVSRFEWVVLILCIGMVMTAEMFNTAIESVCDQMRDCLHAPYLVTQRARDVSAGAVLVVALTAAVVAAFIFWPYLILS